MIKSRTVLALSLVFAVSACGSSPEKGFSPAQMAAYTGCLTEKGIVLDSRNHLDAEGVYYRSMTDQSGKTLIERYAPARDYITLQKKGGGSNLVAEKSMEQLNIMSALHECLARTYLP